MAVKSADKSVRRQSWIIWILSVLLIIALSFIAYVFYSSYQQQRLAEAMNAGYNQGYADAIGKIMQETDSCNPVPVFIGNTTKQIFDVACLQKAQASQQR